MAESDQEKSEQPTPRRRQEARQEGNVAKSMDLTAALMLLAAMGLLYLLGMRILAGMKQSMADALRFDHAMNPTRSDGLLAMISSILRNTVVSVGPMLVALTLVGLIAVLLQVGFVLTAKPLQPKISKLNPIKGAKNLVNLRALMRFVQSMLKLTLIVTTAAIVIVIDLPKIAHISELAVGQAVVMSSQVLFSLGLKLAVLLLILAIIDFTYQKWQHEQDLKMTKQEVKDEMKKMEGDPLVKQRRQRVARQLAMQRTAQAVPKADVVVTNPTHFAVALEYDAATMRAPRVVAKGADLLAMRIRQIATANGIPLVERKPLARALYAGCEVGDEIPAEHYAAVAEILAYVYRLGEKAA